MPEILCPVAAFGDEIDPSLEVQMDVLAEHDIHAIELRSIDGVNVSDFTLDFAREVRRRMDERGFAVSAVASPIGKIGIDEPFAPHLEKFRHTCELARIFGTRYIRMFSFYIPKGDEPDKWRGEVMERLRAFRDDAACEGLILAHENEKDIYGDTAERSLDIINEMKSERFRLVFDPANFIQCGVEPFPHAYELLLPHIEYLHVKDALVSDRSVMPAGYGDGRVRDIIHALAARGYKNYLSIEPHLSNFKGLAGLQLDMDTSRLGSDGKSTFAIAAAALRRIMAG